MRFLYLVLSLLVISGCGVSTSSSEGDIVQESTGLPSEDTNISDGNSSVSENNSSATTNSGGGASASASSTSTGETKPIFDDSLAEYDKNACSSAYATAIPLQDNNTNDDRETNDETNGISIQSLLNGNKEDTTVTAFYKQLPVGTTVGPIEYRENLYGPDGAFLLTYDNVWAKMSDNTIYVQLPKGTDELPSCYRAKLDSEKGSSISFTKVYR